MTLLRTDKPLTVLALDPGEKVGWARAVVLPSGEWHGLEHGITPLKDMALALGKRMSTYDVVIYEKWVLYAHKAQEQAGSDMQSSQFIGIVRYLAWLRPEIALISQGAAIKKTALKTAPKWLHGIVTVPRRHDDAHDMDALLHLWYFCWRHYPIHKLTEDARAQVA